MTTYKVKLRNLRVAPRKIRLIADQIRGLPAHKAVSYLKFTDKAAAINMQKLILSAAANANKKDGVDVDQLFVKMVSVDQGPIIRRFMARARGSASRINKKTSHITLVLGDK